MGRSVSCQKTTRPQNNGDEYEQVVVAQQTDAARIVILHGDVNEHAISSVIVQLLYLANQSKKPIHLIVSTYGGSVDEMFSLYDTIQFLPCPVHTIALGKVMSAGVLLLASGVKGKRLIGRSTRIMMHPVSGGAMGNVFEILQDSKEHVRLHELMVSALEKETNMSSTQIEKIMKSGHDYYITAEKALKLGIVDKII